MNINLNVTQKQHELYKSEAEKSKSSVEYWLIKVADEQVTEFPELMTPAQTAKYLKIPAPSVYYLLQMGKLPGIQIGGRWKVKRDLIDRDILQ